MLFPDLVWAHWAWQSRVRPHTFASRGRARRLLAKASVARLNGRPSRGRKIGENGAEIPGEADLERLRKAYDREAAAFQASEGIITRAYWCASEASAVVLTEKRRRLSWLPWRRCGEQRLHRATDWVTADAPHIAELLHGSDTLAIRISRVLNPVPQRIAMEWIFSEQSYLLGFVERMGGRPAGKETASVVARHRLEVDRIEGYYDRAARKAGRIRYFCGMLLGLVLVAGLGALMAAIIDVFGEVDLASASTRNFYACFGAGAVGALVSVMTRMRQEKGLTLDYEVGPALIVMLGGFRPVLGAIFGTAAYFALESGFLNLTPPSADTVFFYYPLFAFVAGFSERFAHVILGHADLTVARALTGAETPEQANLDGHPPVTAPDGAPARVPTPEQTPPAGRVNAPLP
jgi:hypothetical protein